MGDGTNDAPGMSIELLGGFAVWIGDRLIAGMYTKGRASLLLQFLALQDGLHVRREAAVNALWPASTNGDASFHQALRELRLLVEPDLRRPGSSTYLRMETSWLILRARRRAVDVHAFRDALRRARTTRAPRDYDAALALYTGDLLPGQDEPWARGERARLREELLAGLREAVAVHERAGDPAGAVTVARRLTREAPRALQARSDLIRLLAETGDSDAALREYERAKKRARALGAQLAPETHALANRLLGGLRPGGRPPADAAATGSWWAVADDQAPAANGVADQTNIVERGAPFVGRDAQRQAVRERIERSRLVTLTGTAGAGKTRLALRVALDTPRGAGDLAYALELAPVEDPDDVAQAVESALGLDRDDPATLAARINALLAGRALLLVLDNCEHLKEACARLASMLLDGCPGVRILATSREPLGVAGEEVLAVTPLDLPPRDDDAITAVEAARSDAVALFCQRAAAANPRFALTDANVPLVALICRQLDGLPLALELLAAQVHFLSLGDLARRLDRLSDVMATNIEAEPRHRTLGRALDWSYQRLPPRAATLFRRLAVFAGGWSLEAAELICSGHGIERGEIVHLLNDLAISSLVTAELPADAAEAARFSLLEPVRQYAEDKLREAGELWRLRKRQAVWCALLARRADAGLAGAEQRRWLAALIRESDNLRAGLRWAREAAPATVGTRIAGPLTRYWSLQGMFGEGRQWLEGVIRRALPRVGERVSPAYARVLYGAGWLAVMQGDFVRAFALGRRTIRVWRTQGDAQAGLWGLTILGGIADDIGRTGLAVRLFERCLALAHDVGDQRRIATTLSNLGDELLREGRYEAAWARFGECLDVALRMREEAAIGMALANLGRTAIRLGRTQMGVALLRRALEKGRLIGDARSVGDILIRLGFADTVLNRWSDAADRFTEALALHRRSGHLSSLPSCFDGFGAIAQHLGLARETVRLASFTDALRRSAGTAGFAADERERERAMASLRKRLGVPAFAAEQTAGRTLSMEEAVALTRQIAREAHLREA